MGTGVKFLELEWSGIPSSVLVSENSKIARLEFTRRGKEQKWGCDYTMDQIPGVFGSC